MVRLLHLAFLLALTTEVPAQTVRAVPSTPVAGQPFEITISGFWPTSTLPVVSDVFLADSSTIVITLAVDGGGDPQTSPYIARAAIPALASGNYSARVRLAERGVVRVFATTFNFTVSGNAPKLTLSTTRGGISGGTAVTINCPFASCANAQVLFGTKAAESVTVDGNRLTAITPSNGIGPVNVTLRAGSEERVHFSGFTYLSPNEYDSVLLPSFTGREIGGAFGSRWVIEHGIFNGNDVPLEPNLDFFHTASTAPLPTRAVSPIPTEEPYTRAPNWMVHVRRPVSDNVRYSLRVRDLSRAESTWGTELPVVRERDFTSRVQLFDVPLQERFRQTLRIYALPEGRLCCNELAVRFYAMNQATPLHETTVTLREPEVGAGSREFPMQPETTEIDFLGGISQLAGHDRVRVEIESATRKIWAYVSVTNNETQHVTVVSPQ
ncbi:MAG TPA: IPT/TIG domain-containing protein [Thermoanaerobaculia bacterium]|nr:IPT/TIG domain-containing protein [Thermoanaerobaculia bacterium]